MSVFSALIAAPQYVLNWLTKGFTEPHINRILQFVNDTYFTRERSNLEGHLLFFFLVVASALLRYFR